MRARAGRYVAEGPYAERRMKMGSSSVGCIPRNADASMCEKIGGNIRSVL